MPARVDPRCDSCRSSRQVKTYAARINAHQRIRAAINGHQWTVETLSEQFSGRERFVTKSSEP